jgi:hypothetical protein
MGHAVLSPSAASRWLACTPSVRLEQEFENKTSSFAEEGTLAHAVGECILRELAGQIKPAEAELILAQLMLSQYYSKELHDYAEGYAYFVWAMCKPGTHLFVEQRLDMTDYVEEGFGTGDAIVIGNNVLRLSDLKYGKGVPVYSDNNPQLKLYALGAYKEFSHIFDIDMIEINIYQPRLDNISTWEISVADLLEWAENELKPKAALAYKGEGEFNPGRACTFCKAKVKCRALAEYNMKLAEMEFKNAELLSDEEIAEVLTKKAQFSNWMESLAGYALGAALSGKEIPGFKVVAGRSNRRYSSDEIVSEKLIAKGFTDIYKKPALLALGEMEKKIGKPAFKEVVEPLLEKPPGKPALVVSSDPRAVYAPVEHEFVSYTEEDA